MKVFICHKCKSAFDCQSKLDKHLDRKYPCDAGNYECDKCGKKILYQSNLSTHKKKCKGRELNSQEKDEKIAALETTLEKQLQELPSSVPPIQPETEKEFEEIEDALLDRIDHLENIDQSVPDQQDETRWIVTPLNLASVTETLKPQVYFGLPGPKLRPIHAESKDAILVKFGSTDDYAAQHQIHKADYDGFTLLDSVVTNNPKHVGKNFKAYLQIKDRLVKAKSDNKLTNDSKLFLARSQQDYEDIVKAAVEFAEAYKQKFECKDHIIRQIQMENEVETLRLKLDIMRMKHESVLLQNS